MLRVRTGIRTLGFFFVLAVSLGVTTSRPARAAEACSVLPWQHLGDTASEFARPLPLLLTFGAAATPLYFSTTGLDHQLRLFAQRDLGGRHGLEPVSVLAPYVFTGGILVGYGVSLAASACHWQRPQAAILQAMVLTVGTVALLKWSVGREWPNAGRDPTDPNRLEHRELARHFTPFGAGLGAWPSGHTAFFFAVASALRASEPELGWPRWLGYPVAVGVAAGMWMGDHHWASDIVSGGLLGEAIGSSAGRAFAEPSPRARADFFIVPVQGGVLAGADGLW